MSTKKPRYFPVNAMEYPRYSGLHTFMRLPNITDLATDVDIAIVGVPFDTGGTFRVGARFGPGGIREHSLLLRPYNPELDVVIFDYCSCVDAGDLPTVPGYLPESHQMITGGVKQIYKNEGVIPIFLGGDHSVSLPILRAVADKYGPVGLVHFDSHNDLWYGYFGGKDTHGTPFRRALEEKLIDPSRSCQVGLRGPLYDRSDYTMTEDEGMLMVARNFISRVFPAPWRKFGPEWVRVRSISLLILTLLIRPTPPAQAPRKSAALPGRNASNSCEG